MKTCAYCGRENLDDATHCRECGTQEFEAELPPTTTKDVASAALETDAEALAARAAMENEYLKTDLPENHYLLTSTDEELVEIVAQSSEWSAFDVAHARRLIGQRGIDLKKVEDKRAERLLELRRGRRASKKLVFFGWVFSALGGLIGLGIAWSLVYTKEETPDGEFFSYDEESRAIGRKMLCLAGAVIAIAVVLRLSLLLSR